MCWAAVDRGLKIAAKLGREASFGIWAEIREKMRNRIETAGWNENLGFYTQVFGDANPDAANLLMIPLNFLGPESAKFRRMVENYKSLLMENGYMFRYRRPDDLGPPNHAFTACTFWMVDALASIGRWQEARAILENILSRANHVGLLSEDIDPATGELWGNFPQAYSHVGVINSAFRISKLWSEAF